MERYYIGMDGGGTSTKVLVWDGTRERCRLSAGSLNYNSAGPARIAQALAELRDALAESGFAADDCAAVGIGCAGVSNPAVRPFLEKVFLELGYGCPVCVFGDEEAAMYGAFEEADGILLIAGTGSICLGQTGQGARKYRAVGYGHLIDDEGSAYALGRDILSAVVRAEDGRAQPTVLRDAVFGRLGISAMPELVGYVYAQDHTKKEIAALASLLSLPEAVQDAAVRRIVDKAAGELACLVQAVFGKMQRGMQAGSEVFPLVLHGSVLERNAMIRDRLTAGLRAVCPGVRLAQAAGDAAQGAAKIAEASAR